MVEEIIAELGGNVSPMRRVLIEQLARLKIRTSKRADDVRAANVMIRLAREIGIKDKPAPPAGESLRDVLRELATDAADARSNGGGG